MVLHPLQFVIESKLLISMEIGETPAELQRRPNPLKQCGQLLNGRLRGIVEGGGSLALAIFVDEFLGSGKGQLAIAGVDFSGKIMSLSREIENADAGWLREFEFCLVRRVLVGGFRHLRGTFVACATVGLDSDRVVIGIGIWEIQQKCDAGGFGGVHLKRPEQSYQDQQKREYDRGRAVKPLSVSYAIPAYPHHRATLRCRLSVPAVWRWQIAMASASEASIGSGGSERSRSRVTMCCTCCFSARP